MACWCGLRAAGSAAFALGTLVSGYQAGGVELATAMWTSGALVLGGGRAVVAERVAGRIPDLRATMLRDGVLLLCLPIYRRLLVAAALLEGSHALYDSFSVIRWRSAGIDFFTISALWSRVGVRRGGGVPADRALAGAAGRPERIEGARRRGRCSLLEYRGVRDIARAARLQPALARADLRSVPPRGDPTYRGRGLVRLAATAQAIYGTLCVGLAIALLTFASGLLYAPFGGEAFPLVAALCLVAAPIRAGLRAPSEAMAR
jgi:MFS transporter, PPP family, 3-phenylpropionic acid transporter